MDINQHPPHMFENPKIDYFFRWQWWAAPVTFLPITAYALFYTYSKLGTPLFAVALQAFFGVLLWTLFEYGMHRFIFHFIGKSPKLQHMHYVVHGMHHAYPTDPLRVIFPPLSSAIVGALIAAVLMVILPLHWALSVFAGFILGYCWYEFFHYAAHHIKWRLGWFSRLKRHHLLHHHSGNYRERNFGVTSSLWDRVFGTYLR